MFIIIKITDEQVKQETGNIFSLKPNRLKNKEGKLRLFNHLLVKHPQIPFIFPFNYRLAVHHFYGETDVAAVDMVSGFPAVGHEDKSVLFAGYRKDKRTLGIEGELCPFAYARVFQRF